MTFGQQLAQSEAAPPALLALADAEPVIGGR
jgi:hypothetical protein